MKVEELDQDAIRRIAARTNELMQKKLSLSPLQIKLWFDANPSYIDALLRSTWIATREELERQEKSS